MTNEIQVILAMFDAGKTPVEIIAKGFTNDKVYQVLRAHRPARDRAPKRRTSRKPAQIRALFAEKMKPVRIAEICDCSPAYVYRILQEARTG